jgi:PAS domain S-box-containing protein
MRIRRIQRGANDSGAGSRRHQVRARLGRAQAAMVMGIVLAGVMVSAVLVQQGRSDAHAEQQRLVQRVSVVLGEQIAQASGLAQSARGLLESSSVVTAAEFGHFAAVAMERSRLLGMAWAPLVPAALRARYERSSGLSITRLDANHRPRPEGGGRAVSYPITYLAPAAAVSSSVLGLDLATQPGLAAALAMARDRGAVALAPAHPLVGTTDFGLTLSAPVYAPGARPRTLGARRGALRGFVTATFRVDDLAATAGAALPAGAVLQIRDAGTLVAGSPGALSEASRVSLAAGGRQWLLAVRVPDRSTLALPLLAGGGILLGGLLIAALFAAANRRRDQSEMSADEQGALLRVATAVAESAPAAELFALVAREAAALLGADYAGVYRFLGAEAVLVGSRGPNGPLGEIRVPLGGGSAVALAARGGAPARVRDYAALGDEAIGAVARAFGWRGSVAAPVRVGGVSWGAVVVASTAPEPLPASAEERLGQFARLVAVAIADSEAHDALRGSEERFRTLVVQAPVGILEVDAAGNYRFANERWRELTGLSAGAAAGHGWMSALHPKDRGWLWKQWGQWVATGSEFVAEYRYRTPDGRVSWVASRAVPLRGRTRATTGYLITLADLTEQKRAEQQLRAERDYAHSLMSAMQDALVVLSPTGRLTDVSPAFCEMTGFTRTELLGACAPFPYWPTADQAAVERGFARIAASGSCEWDLPFRRKDGTPLPVILKAALLPAIGYVATVKDLTILRRAEQAVRGGDGASILPPPSAAPKPSVADSAAAS